MDTTELEVEDRNPDGSLRNPADMIDTYYVTIRDLRTGEQLPRMRIHDYSIEDCALRVLQELDSGFELIEVYQPDTKNTLSYKAIKEL